MTTPRCNRQTVERIELQARAMRRETISRLFADGASALYRACCAVAARRRQVRTA